MKHYFNILCIFVFMMVMASCHDHDEPENIYAEKTIFIYMPYTGSSGNLHDYFVKNISDIRQSLQTHGLGNNKVIAFVSQSAYHADYIEFCKNKKGDIVCDTLNSVTTSDTDFTTTEGLAAILSSMKRYAPAREYAMVIGAHGMGWLPTSNSTVRRNRFFGSATAQYQTDLSTLVESLQCADIHLQFALFDCCYMACIENVYEMRNVTDYYIGSTSEILNDGMPYSCLFHSLMLSQPDYGNVVDQFNAYYSDYTYYGTPYPYGTISVSDCSYAGEMAEMMREINSFDGFAENVDRNLSSIQDLDAGMYSPTIFYDFGSYVGHGGLDNGMQTRFLALLQKLVPYSKSTEQIISGSPFMTLDVKEFSGLTISDPSTNQKVLESKQQTTWWKATH